MLMPSESNSKRIFVAGASGVVGQRLCRLLIEEGWRVTGMTRSTEKASALRAIGVTPIIVDVFDEKMLHKVIAEAKPAIVVHQLTDLPPGLDRTKMAEALIRNARIRDIGTRNLIAAAVASGIERMVAQSISFAHASGPLPYHENASLNVDAPDEAGGLSARAVSSLERQVLNGPFIGIVLRYGKFYGPGTGFHDPPRGGSVHVDAAADAARRAVTRGRAGVYNIAEDDGTVSSQKAADELRWSSDFRID